MKLFLTILFLFLGINAQAQKCLFEIDNVDSVILLPNVQKVIEPQNYINSANQQIRRYVQLFSDGAMVVVEQKNCQTENISVSIFMPSGGNVEEGVKKVLLILSKMPEWKNRFDKIHMKTLQGDISSVRVKESIDKPINVIRDLKNEIKIEGKKTNVSWELNSREAGSGALFRTVFSVFVSVGG
jgi:hypothetical protein